MRILHVTPYFEGAWAYGGIPRAVAPTVRGLEARGHQVTVCTTDVCDADRRLPPAGGQDGCDIRVFRNLSNAAAYHLQFFVPLGMSAFLQTHVGQFDVVHVHGLHHLPGVFAARACAREGVPYVLTPHGTAPYIERRRLAKRVFDLTIGRGVVQGASAVIAVSGAERDQLRALGVQAADIVVIPNPLAFEEFEAVPRGAFRRRIGASPDQPLVVYLGKLTPRKRLDTLAQAFARLERADARLIIAGNDMGYGAQLRRLVARLGLADRTLFTGLLPGRARLEALADADVVTYASEHEVFGLVPVEALLCGTPVVVANDSGCGEVIAATGAGLTVPPGNAAELARAIARVLEDVDAWRDRVAAARPGLARYERDQVCAELARLYERVGGPRPDSFERHAG